MRSVSQPNAGQVRSQEDRDPKDSVSGPPGAESEGSDSGLSPGRSLGWGQPLPSGEGGREACGRFVNEISTPK